MTSIGSTEVYVKRDDLMGSHVSGNKLYKLKYNIEAAKTRGKTAVLTFGGAYSNHIVATAAYCNGLGLQSIGVIRGEEHTSLNPSLSFAREQGMSLHYISRGDYRNKEDHEFLSVLGAQFDDPFIIPEGGANEAGIRGAMEILDKRTKEFDIIACAVGTGTTVAALLHASESHQRIWGVPVHKYASIMHDVLSIYPMIRAHDQRLEVLEDYHFGGYAKWNGELIDFIRTIYRDFNLKLEPIYTAKAFYGLLDRIDGDKPSKGQKALFIHTGGMQGIAGFEERHKLRLFD